MLGIRTDYVVKPGDTIRSIAWRYNLDHKQLSQWNNLSNPDLIFPGQKLALVANKSRPAKAKPKPVVADPKFDKSRDEIWAWPINDFRREDIVGDFSWNGKEGSKGLAISGKEGMEVLAARSGTVVYVGDDISGYGNMVILQHDETYLSAYGHNESIQVEEDDWVKQGESIATMGRTDSQHVKLHFEIRKESIPINPLDLLKAD